MCFPLLYLLVHILVYLCIHRSQTAFFSDLGWCCTTTFTDLHARACTLKQGANRRWAVGNIDININMNMMNNIDKLATTTPTPTTTTATTTATATATTNNHVAAMHIHNLHTINHLNNDIGNIDN